MNDVHIPLKEKLKSIPEVFGIRMNEEPEYQVIKKDGDFEIRHYPKQLIAKITIHDIQFDEFRELAFKRLASYIFEENTNNEAVPMTSPVLEQQEITGAWTMSFILPKEYSLTNAPHPNDIDITLAEVEPHYMASLSYTGNNTLEKIRLHEKELANWLRLEANFKSTGHFFAAQYDAPFVIPFLKKNEVQIKLNTFH